MDVTPIVLELWQQHLPVHQLVQDGVEGHHVVTELA